MQNIFVTRKIPDSGLQKLKAAGFSVTINKKDTLMTHKELVKEFRKNKYDAVLSLLTDEIDADLIDVMHPNVKVIAQFAVGFNNIDIDHAASKGISVLNTPATSGREVAEHAIALLMCLNMDICKMDSYVRSGKYKGWDPLLLRGPSLQGKTLGIIGAGNIGENTAKIAENGLGMNILYHDVRRNTKIESVLHAEYMENIDDLLRKSDVVSLHVPLNPNTYHLIDENQLVKMKSSSLLVNTSRGAVVNEKALVKALKQNMLRGAALDVYEEEPALAKGLTKMENVVLTPHIGSATKINREEMSIIAAQNIIDFFDNTHLKNKVN
jgi:glyoxylate reductase